MPEGKFDDTLAEEFAEYLLEKIEKIRQQFINISPFKPTPADTPRLQEFAPLTTEEVKKEISSLKNKPCELDLLQTHLIKRYAMGMPRCSHNNYKYSTHRRTVLHGMEHSFSQTLAHESRFGAYKQNL